MPVAGQAHTPAWGEVGQLLDTLGGSDLRPPAHPLCGYITPRHSLSTPYVLTESRALGREVVRALAMAYA